MKIYLEKNLRYLRKKAGLSQNDIADKFGYKSYTTIQKWETGDSEPSVSVVRTLADMYNVSLSDIVYTDLEFCYGEDLIFKKDKLNKNYDILSTEGKHTLVSYSDALVRDESNRVKEDTEIYSVQVTESVAAGLGYRYGNNETTTYYTDRDDLKDYDYATLVRGDSMEPAYHDGDIILVKAGYDNSNGDVYVIDYDGKSYVKKLYNDGDRFRLVSINRDYENIIIDLPIKEGLYFNIVGKVIDSFKPIEK